MKQLKPISTFQKGLTPGKAVTANDALIFCAIN